MAPLSNDQDISVQDVLKFAKKICTNQFEIICIQSIFKEHLFNVIHGELSSSGYKIIPSSEHKNEAKMVIPGLLFATTLSVLKWEFEEFHHQDDKVRHTGNQTMKGLLSVLLDLNGRHLWIFSPQFQDSKKVTLSENDQSLMLCGFLEQSLRITHSKVWYSDKQPTSIEHKDLTYGSIFELLYGQMGAIYDKPDMLLGAGTRIRDQLQRFKVLRVNQTAPPRPVCYGDSVLLQTHKGLFPYLSSDHWIYNTAPEPKGARSVLTFIDPRHIESTAPIRNNDQFVIRDFLGSYLAVKNGHIVGGKQRIEDATLFRLDIFAVVPLDQDGLNCQVATSGSTVVFEEVREGPDQPHYMSVEPSYTSRWQVHTESLHEGDLESYEIVDSKNYFDVGPLWNNQLICLRSITGHYLSIDPKTGWLYSDVKKPDVNTNFCLATELGIRDERKWKSSRQSVSKPFNVEKKMQVDQNFVFNFSSKPEEIFTILEVLGEGSFGKVYRARHVDGFELAIKAVSTDKSDEIQSEIDILKVCRHECVVSYYGSVKNESVLWILMEYMELGSIRDMIDTRKSPLTEPEIGYVCASTLKGLNYLHSLGIIHRDVKAANILLNERAEIKIADFGVSEYFAKINAKQAVGTPLWMSPEVLRRNPATLSCDIWSLGISVIEMGDGVPPNHNVPILKAMKSIVDVNIPSPTFSDPQKWSLSLVDFVAQCLEKDTTKRPSAYQLLSHPFLENVCDNSSLREQMLLTSLLIRKIKLGQTNPQLTTTNTSTNHHQGDEKKPNNNNINNENSNTQLSSLLSIDLHSIQKSNTNNITSSNRNTTSSLTPTTSTTPKKKDKFDKGKKLEKKDLKRENSEHNILHYVKSQFAQMGKKFPADSRAQVKVKDDPVSNNSTTAPTTTTSKLPTTLATLFDTRKRKLKRNLTSDSNTTKIRAKPVIQQTAHTTDSPMLTTKRRSKSISDRPVLELNLDLSISYPKSLDSSTVQRNNSSSNGSVINNINNNYNNYNNGSGSTNTTTTNASSNGKVVRLSKMESVLKKSVDPESTPEVSPDSYEQERSRVQRQRSTERSVREKPKIKKTKSEGSVSHRAKSHLSHQISSTAYLQGDDKSSLNDHIDKRRSASNNTLDNTSVARVKHTTLNLSNIKTSLSADVIPVIIPSSPKMKGSLSDRKENNNNNISNNTNTNNNNTNNNNDKIEKESQKPNLSGSNESQTKQEPKDMIINVKKQRRRSDPGGLRTDSAQAGTTNLVNGVVIKNSPSNDSVLNVSDSSEEDTYIRTVGSYHDDTKANKDIREESTSDVKSLEQSRNQYVLSDEENEDDEEDITESSLWCLGNNSHYQLGLKKNKYFTTPQPCKYFKDLDVDMIACGGSHSMVFADNNLFCFGDNTHGQLGVGGDLNHPVKPTVNPFFKRLPKIVALSSGLHHSMVLTEDGKLWSFGRNTVGELGIVNYFNQPTPQHITYFTKKVVSFACGTSYSMVVTEDGNLYGFGESSFGGIGNGPSEDDIAMPEQVLFLSDKTATKVATKGYFTLVVTDEGKLFSFGENSYGQLGLGHRENQNRPQLVVGLAHKKVVDISCGMFHSLALTDEGQLYAWGRNKHGQLGLGTTVDHDSPHLVSFFSSKKVVKMSCGLNYTMVMTDTNQLFAFGNNTHGQLGLSNTHMQPTPQLVQSFQGYKVLSFNCGHTFTLISTERSQGSNAIPTSSTTSCTSNSTSNQVEADHQHPVKTEQHVSVVVETESTAVTKLKKDESPLHKTKFKREGPKFVLNDSSSSTKPKHSPSSKNNDDNQDDSLSKSIPPAPLEDRGENNDPTTTAATATPLHKMFEDIESSSPPTKRLSRQNSVKARSKQIKRLKKKDHHNGECSSSGVPSDQAIVDNMINNPISVTSVDQNLKISADSLLHPKTTKHHHHNNSDTVSNSHSLPVVNPTGTTIIHYAESDTSPAKGGEKQKIKKNNDVNNDTNTNNNNNNNNSNNADLQTDSPPNKPRKTKKTKDVHIISDSIANHDNINPTGTTIIHTSDEPDTTTTTTTTTTTAHVTRRHSKRNRDEHTVNSSDENLDSKFKKTVKKKVHKRPEVQLNLHEDEISSLFNNMVQTETENKKNETEISVINQKITDDVYDESTVYSEEDAPETGNVVIKRRSGYNEDEGRNSPTQPHSSPQLSPSSITSNNNSSISTSGRKHAPKLSLHKSSQNQSNIPHTSSSERINVYITGNTTPSTAQSPKSSGRSIVDSSTKKAVPTSSSQEDINSPFTLLMKINQPNQTNSYISYGNHIQVKWKSTTESIEVPLYKSYTSQSSVFAHLRSGNSKKFKGSSVTFKLKLKQQGPVKLKKSSHIMAMFIGDLNYNFKQPDIPHLRSMLGNPKDVFEERHPNEKGYTYTSGTTSSRRNFIFVYDSMPMDKVRKISSLECEDCKLCDDSSIHGVPHVPVTFTFKLI
eukprot:TRINITY_DN3812_c0_g2_i2.p1 TRINITY_DN3812_c0_g2~~TRINITY_DN3812_c0_g2_i2.p1  ORF type:complete len:2464 (-),score=554.47 TRINITY_DN3812_c0_g2_i2:160-7446(-)